MRALILVDLQNDFMPGGALGVAEGNQVVPIANQLIPTFPVVVATQDQHPRDHGSFVTQHPAAKVGDQVELHGLSQTVWPVHCVEGSSGAELHQDLHKQGVGHCVPKGTDRDIDSYSGFFDNGKRKATGLESYLREQGVDEVYVMGLALDYCVKFTALDAAALGFRTHLIVDGCRAVELQAGDGARAIAALEAAGVTVVRSGDLLAAV